MAESIKYIGANTHDLDLFEGQYSIPNGMAYNSYVIDDEKIAIMDTVDNIVTDKWLENLKKALDGREPEYLVVQHLEPDHSGNINTLLKMYPHLTLVCTAKAKAMLEQFDIEAEMLWQSRRATSCRSEAIRLNSFLHLWFIGLRL